MTLEEQIRPHTQYWDCYNDCPLEYNHTGKVLKIVNLFAIGFADWFFEHCYEDQVGYYEAADLLEKYKKEKGL